MPYAVLNFVIYAITMVHKPSPLELCNQCMYVRKYIRIHICMQIWHIYCKVLYVVREYTTVVGSL